MTAHLLLVTLGPVQDFIAQARRTRDLWYGSHLLSEIGRRAARSLVDQGALLVFPALEAGNLELEACFAPTRAKTEQPPLSIANKLLAEVPATLDPKDVAKTLRESVKGFFRGAVASRTRGDCKGLFPRDIGDAWDEQIDTLLELGAAWAPLGEYRETRRKVERAIAGRKNLRDFRPWKHLRANVPKSSLDGARETVLLPPGQRDEKLVRRYRIGEGEQLDAVGLVKRTGGKPEQFVPIVNVALASWLALAGGEANAELEGLLQACEALDLAPVDRPDLPCAKPFGFDAGILLESRWKAIFEEQGLHGDAETWARTHVRPLLAKLSAPCPYVACLVADGDGMGRALDALGTADEHRAFSKALAGFASEARRIVEQQHRGSLVYAGGDDVLGFLPVPEATACASALRLAFQDIMAEACAGLPVKPTLSVGIGIGHAMEAMGDLLDLGRDAERLAKGAELREKGLDRNALAVILDKRSGGRQTWRARWDEWDGDPAGRLGSDADVMRDDLSSRKVYEVGRTLRRLPRPDDAPETGWATTLELDVRRSLSRANAGDRPLDVEMLGLRLDAGADYADLHARVSAWVDRMVIARTMAAATPRVRRTAQEGTG